MMIKTMNRVLITVFIGTYLSLPSDLIAQTTDFGVWASAGIEKEVRKLDFILEAEIRTQDNASQVDRWSLGLSADYRLCKPLSMGVAYQFIGFHDVEYADYQPRHRFAFDLTGKQRFGNLTVTLRERIQLTTRDESDRIKSNGEINLYKIDPDITWRNRLRLSWNIPHFPVTPSLSFETFYQLNNPEGNSFEDLRTMVSFRYKVHKSHFFEVYGLLDKEINVADPVTTMVAGLSYVFSL
jgi:hypothetical protein